MSRIQLAYRVAGEGPRRRVLVASDATVGDLLDAIRRETGRTDLTTITSGDVPIPETEKADDWADEPLVVKAGGFIDITQSTAKVHVKGDDQLQNIKDGQLRVFTTQDYDTMVHGRVMDIPLNSTRRETEEAIRREFKIGPDKCVLLYLSGGMVFSEEYRDRGTKRPMRMSDFFDKCDFVSRKVYAVVVERPRVGENVFKALKAADCAIVQLCSYATEEMKYLLSPVKEAANDTCYSAMACLLGYLSANGYRSGLLVSACAFVTGFAPLVCGLSRIMRGCDLDGMTVAAVTASLYALCRFLVPVTVDDSRGFEYLLRVCSYLSHINTPPQFEEVTHFVDHVRDGSDLERFLADSDQANPFCDYSPDGLDEDIPLLQMTELNYAEVERAFQTYKSFRPVGAASLHSVFNVSILHYKEGTTALFLKRDGDGYIVFIDPRRGGAVRATEERLAEVVADSYQDTSPILLDPLDVQEIFLVEIDCSGSMNTKLDGKSALGLLKPKPAAVGGPVGDTTRMHIAWQYLSLLTNRLYGFRIPCLLGLIQFNDTITSVCEFSPASKDFELGIAKLNVRGQTRLYDAIVEGVSKLSTFDPEGLYYRAKKRILVFSDGVDSHSEHTDPKEVAQQLIDHNIILDSVHLTTKGTSQDLVKLSHLTGGYAFQVTDSGHGLSWFENEAFLILRMRPERFIPRTVTQEVWDSASVKFDNDIQNTELLTASKRPAGLYTPRGILAHEKTEPHTERREKRMLKEIRRILAHQDDDQFRVYVNSRDFNEWKLFVASPAESVYGNVWWSMSVVFPPEYPNLPPLFRFVSDIHHVNVSDDGRVCLYELNDGYNAKKTVWSLIKAVLSMFTKPQVQFATQIERRLQFVVQEDRSFAPNDEYIGLCRDSALNAKPDAEGWLTGIPDIYDDDGGGGGGGPAEDFLISCTTLGDDDDDGDDDKDDDDGGRLNEAFLQTVPVIDD